MGKSSGIFVCISTIIALSSGCKSTCLDDGFAWQQAEDCGIASQTNSESNTVTVTESATDTNTDSNSNSNTDTAGTDSMSATLATESDTSQVSITDSATDTDSATATDTDTDTGGPGCGNGVIDDGEVCDDGINDGGYNGCMPGCGQIGPYCGDGVVFDGAELCDDANDIDDDECSNACGADKCNEIMVQLEPLTPKVALLVDKSGSMVANKWDHDADANTPTVTRWFSLYTVVSFILDNFDSQLDFGLVLFPSKNAKASYDAQACLVEPNPEVNVAPSNKNAILSVLPPANSGAAVIAGGTPASSGLITAINHLKTFDPKFPRVIFNITDGAPNCRMDAENNAQRFESYDMAVHTIVESARLEDNIFTYQIGIDISKLNTGNVQDGNPDNIVPYDKMNEIAVLGGKPKDDPTEKFYAANNEIELKDALELIAKDALSCIVGLDEPPIFPQNTKVIIGNDLVPKVTDCLSEDGWVYTNDQYEAIELCGSYCAQLKEVQILDVEYYCKPG